MSLLLVGTLFISGCSTSGNVQAARPVPSAPAAQAPAYVPTEAEVEFVNKYAEVKALFAELNDQADEEYLGRLVNSAGQLSRGVSSEEAPAGLERAHENLIAGLDAINSSWEEYANAAGQVNWDGAMPEIQRGSSLIDSAESELDYFFAQKSADWRDYIGRDLKRRTVQAKSGQARPEESDQPAVEDFGGKYQGIGKVIEYESDGYVVVEVVSGTIFYNGANSKGTQVAISLGGDYRVMGETKVGNYLGYLSPDGYTQMLEPVTTD